jgi:EpsD family peptidyl-prolyl cis-trans isomerase
MQRTTRLFVITGAALAAAALASCKGVHATDKTQVVAHVNDAEITVSQLRAALAAKGDTQPSEQATQAALDGLVNEQLLVDAALRSRLDRDPAVVQAMESARRQLLARAYLERAVFPRQEISAGEQAAYYKAHPELFSQRRVYQLTTFTFENGKLEAGLLDKIGAAHSAEAVAAALAAHRIEPETQTLMRAAEQLPLDQLPRFATASVGDVIVQTLPERVTLMVVTAVQSSPLTFESAQPIIQQYLSNMRNAQALDAHLKEARAAAKITSTDVALLAGAAAQPADVAAAGAVRESRADTGAAVLN